MENEGVRLLHGIVLVISLCVLIATFLAERVVRFNRQSRYILMKMRKAKEDAEYLYWHRELRCHYLRLIPFVTARNVARVYRFVFRRPETAEKGKRSDGLVHILAPSALGAALCAVCLCGMSWAWFTSSADAGMGTIRSASYTVSVTARNGEKTVPVTAANGISTVPLAAGQEYTVTLTPAATAKSGYCLVIFEDKAYTTGQLVGEAYTFTVYAGADGQLTVEPRWGSSGDAVDRIEGSLGTKPAAATTTAASAAATSAPETTVTTTTTATTATTASTAATTAATAPPAGETEATGTQTSAAAEDTAAATEP